MTETVDAGRSVARERIGIGLRVLSGLMLTGMALCVKAIGTGIPLGQIVFFRSVFALLPLVTYLAVCGVFPTGLYTQRPLGHVLRCTFGVCGLFTAFASLRYIAVAEYTMLVYLSPVLVICLAGLLLGEAITKRRMIAVALGFFGVVVLTTPEVSGAVSLTRVLGFGLALATALLSAAAMIQIRRLTRSENSGAIAFYFAATGALAGLCTLPFAWVTPDAWTLILLIAAGLFGGAGHIAMTLCYRYAEASAVAPFDYLTILWAVTFGFLLFGETPGIAFALAAPLVIGGALVASANGTRRSGGR